MAVWTCIIVAGATVFLPIKERDLYRADARRRGVREFFGKRQDAGDEMKRRILLFVLAGLILGMLSTGSIAAGEEATENGGAAGADSNPLPFWGIDLADFHAGTPRPISIPGTGGALDYYWYWPFKFRFNTNLQEMRKHYDRMSAKLTSSGADDEVEMLRRNIERIDQTIKTIDHTKLYVTVYTDSGELLADNGNLVVRNLVERELGKKVYTAKEISGLDLNTIEDTFDPEYGKGKWISGVAIFNNIPANARQFEIRVSGLGKRLMPLFLPGRLLYPESTLEMANAFRPTMRRDMRYFYRRIGQSPEARLTPVEYEGRKAEWIWIWPMEVFVGRYREVEVERTSGLKRKYVYAPYCLWNNTHLPQKIEVKRAGFSEEVIWGGEKIRVTIADNGDTDSRWKIQVMDKIKARMDGGEEKSFAEKYETYPVLFSATYIKKYVDLKEYYEKDYPGKNYDPKDPEVRRNIDSVIEKHREELSEKLKASDLEHKSKILPEGLENRLYKGVIESGKTARGVFIVRWGIENLDELLNILIARLQSESIAGVPADAKPLLLAYNKILKPNPNPEAAWARPSEPDRDKIVQMLVELAQKEIKEKNIEVGEEDAQRYGALAPLGVLLNQYAWDRLSERAEKTQTTDVFFEVVTTAAPESAHIASRFQRFLPVDRDPLPEPPDDFKDEGTKFGVSKGSLEDELKKKGGEKKDEGEKKEAAEEAW